MDLVEDFFDHLDSPHNINDHTLGSLIPKNSSTPKNRDSPSRREMGNKKPASGNENMKKTVLPKALFGEDGYFCSHQEQTQQPKPVVEVVCATPADSVVTSVLKDDKNENSLRESPLLLKNQTESPKKTSVFPAVVLKRLTFNDAEAPPLESVASPSKRQNEEMSDTPVPAKKQMMVMSPTSDEEENVEPDNPDASLLKVSEKVKEKSIFLQISRKNGLSEKGRKKPLVLTPPKLSQTDLVENDFIEKDPEDFAFHSWITIPKKRKYPPVHPSLPEQNQRDQKKINDEPAATEANKNQVEAKQHNTEAAAKKKEHFVMEEVPLSKKTQKESSEKHNDSDTEDSLKVINNLQQTETKANKKKSNQARVQYKTTKVTETKRKNTVEVPKPMKSNNVDSECGSEEALILCLPQLSAEDMQHVGKQDGSCCSHQEQTQNPKTVVEVVCASPTDSAITSVLKDDENENSIKGFPLLVKNRTESQKETFVLPAAVLKRLTFNDTEAPTLESFSSQSKRQNKEMSDTPTPAKKQMLVIMSPTSNEEENMEPDNPNASLLKVSEKVKEKSRFLQILRKTGLSEKRRKKPLVLTPPKLPQTDFGDDDFIEKDPEDFTFHSWITIPKKKKYPPVQPSLPEQNRRDQKKINEEPAATEANKNQVEAKQHNAVAAAKIKEDIMMEKVPQSKKKQKVSSEKHNEFDAEEGSLKVINDLRQTETNANKKPNQARVQYKKTKVTETKRKNMVEVLKSVKNKNVDSECGNEEALMPCVLQLSLEDVQSIGKKGKTIKKTDVKRRKNSHADKSKKSSLSRADSNRKDPSSALLRSRRLRRTPSTWWAVKSDSQDDVEGGLSTTCSFNRDPSPSPPLSKRQSTSPAKNMKKINATGRKKSNKRRSSSGPQCSERDSSEYTLDDQDVKGSLIGPGTRKNLLKDKANKSSCSSDSGSNGSPSLDTSCSKQLSRLPVKSKKTDVKQRNGQANKDRAKTNNSSRPLNSVRSSKKKLNKECKQRNLSPASAGSNNEPSPVHSRTSRRQKTGPRTWWIVKSDEDTAALKNLPEKTKQSKPLISKVPKASRQLTPRSGKTPKSILKKKYCQSTRSTDVHESTAEEDDESEEEEHEVVNKEANDTVFFKLTQNQTAGVQKESRLPSFKESLVLGSHLYAPNNFKTSLSSFGVAYAPTPAPGRGKSITSPVPSISKGQVTIRSPVLSARALIHKNDPKSIGTPHLQRDLETDSDSRSEGDFYLDGVAPLSDPQMEQFHSGAEDGACEDEEQGIPSQASLRSTFTLSENSVTNLGQHHNSGPDLRRSVPAVKGGRIHFEDLTSVLSTNTPEKREERVDYRITQPGDFIADEILSPERELQQSSQNHASTRGTYQNLISGTLSTEMMAKLHRWLCGPGELAAQGNYNEIKTKLQDENGRLITLGCVKSIDMHNFKWYTLSNNYMGISREITESTFTHGKVLLGPFMEKPCQYVHTNTMVLNVVTGSVNVYIHLSQYQLSTGSVFYVPPGNIYGVVNITDQPALLYFTEIKVR
ncbi:centromere protein C isoform X2 [Polyodon spathula]|nr:centromere protein C isoform X2 [Polyodon spathula]